VQKRLAAFRWSTPIAELESPLGFSKLLLGLTAVYLAVGVLAFAVSQFTGNHRWVSEFFAVPCALWLVWMAAIELWFAIRVKLEFSSRQPLHVAWRLITLSAGCHLVGALCVQILSVKSLLNPLSLASWWTPSIGQMINDFGFIVGGTCRLLFLALGLYWALVAYRQTGFLGRLAKIDWLLLFMVLAYVGREADDVISALRRGARPTPATIMGWPVDPMIIVLLAQAMLLHRSVQRMGLGWIALCWRAFTAGVLLIALGDFILWATNWGWIQWPWTAIGWYVWIPESAAFALAPVYQLEAMCYASAGRVRIS